MGIWTRCSMGRPTRTCLEFHYKYMCHLIDYTGINATEYFYNNKQLVKDEENIYVF